MASRPVRSRRVPSACGVLRPAVGGRRIVATRRSRHGDLFGIVAAGMEAIVHLEHNGVFVTAATGTADLVAAELTYFGCTEVREVQGGASCLATLEQAYRVCLWSRLGLR